MFSPFCQFLWRLLHEPEPKSYIFKNLFTYKSNDVLKSNAADQEEIKNVFRITRSVDIDED